MTHGVKPSTNYPQAPKQSFPLGRSRKACQREGQRKGKAMLESVRQFRDRLTGTWSARCCWPCFIINIRSSPAL